MGCGRRRKRPQAPLRRAPEPAPGHSPSAAAEPAGAAIALPLRLIKAGLRGWGQSLLRWPIGAYHAKCAANGKPGQEGSAAAAANPAFPCAVSCGQSVAGDDWLGGGALGQSLPRRLLTGISSRSVPVKELLMFSSGATRAAAAATAPRVDEENSHMGGRRRLLPGAAAMFTGGWLPWERAFPAAARRTPE